jgi:hypothetical protein
LVGARCLSLEAQQGRVLAFELLQEISQAVLVLLSQKAAWCGRGSEP